MSCPFLDNYDNSSVRKGDKSNKKVEELNTGEMTWKDAGIELFKARGMIYNHP